MHNEFDSKGMISVAIVLLTHKMTAVFEADRFSKKEITPDMICDEIDCIGFGATLSGMTEISLESSKQSSKTLAMSQNQQSSDQENSNDSIDSARIRGEDSDSDIF